MKVKTLLELGCACETCKTGSGGCVTYPDGKIPTGTVLDWSDCWRLVYHGAAVPADEECEAKIHMTPRQREVAQRGQRRAAAGIHPDDFEKFDSGEMTGYYGDGSYIPGPSATHTEGGLFLDDYE